MPYQPMPQFKAVPASMFEIPQPAIGGLNLKDLEFEQEVNQSPYMLNVMYRNGAFGKRYGQDIYAQFPEELHAVTSFGGNIYVHAGTKIYKYDGVEQTVVKNNAPAESGLFITYAQNLYYINSSGIDVLKEGVFAEADIYIPDYLINCRPDGTGENESGTVQDELNLIGLKFKYLYNADGTSADYIFGTYDGDEIIDLDAPIVVEVDDVESSDYTLDKENKKIVFTEGHIPPAGNLNVVITFTMKTDAMSDERNQVLSCKYYETFGGVGNSRVFLAGCGNSKYFYSESSDITYFPNDNFATVGNTEDDISGFGRQYNSLIIFKPREVYSLISYYETSSTTLIESNIGMEAFKTQLVNARMGCDAPHSIQLINNLLTWFNSKEGICTLVSTNIQDERNVRVISRNIDRTNNFGIKGILDFDEDLNSIQSVDYNNKYFLVFPESGKCFAWDYEISPYRYSVQYGDTQPRALDWFLFDNFHVKQFLKFNKQLIYINSSAKFNKCLIKLTSEFSDFDINEDEEIVKIPIHSYYMTPFLQFGAVESLKNVNNIYVQCRGDTASVIDMWYYTEENTRTQPEIEPEQIRIGGKLWAHFQWSNFQWLVVNWANTFRRKCNLKKIQMASFYFDNNEVDRDMSITHIGLQYQIVKYIR